MKTLPQKSPGSRNANCPVMKLRPVGHTTWLAFVLLQLALCALLLAANSTRAAVHYVDANTALPAPPFTNWVTAAATIQQTVDAAVAGDEIVVTNGLYATGGRAVSGTMTNRVAVDKPVTVRSVNGPQFTIIEGYQLPGTTNGDGAIRCVYLADGASLTGFTLTNGATENTEGEDGSGGGVWSESTNAIVSNCMMVGNSAAWDGGGAWSGTLNRCTLSANSALGQGWGGGGGGAAGNGDQPCLLNNCTLTGNQASVGGGTGYDCTLKNCTLTGNSAVRYGGGAYRSTLRNCVLAGNSAERGGGAAGATLNNCTLTGNSAGWEGGGVSYAPLGPSSTLNNCIVYFNTSPKGANYSPGTTLKYCCTTPLPANGAGNIDSDPQLLDSAHLASNSPCRGAGSAAYTTGADIDGEAWANPPSIGCDEYYPGSATGPLSVTLGATFTNVSAGYSVGLTGLIDGHASLSVWDFGDGLALTNRPYTTHAWTMLGDYAVVLRAYNENNPGGVSATVTVHVVAQPVHYVAADNATPVAPYTSWATAATNIQDAVDAASVASLPPGSVLVLVTNGVYAAGGRAVVGTMTNRVAVDKPLILRSVNGPQFTVIQGRQVPGTTNGDGAIRCVYLTNAASLSGFTLTKGATRVWASGIYDNELSGGGLWCESSAVVSNCVLVGNSANRGGGGVARPEVPSVEAGTIAHCTLATNSALFGGGAWGGNLEDCTLIGNTASSGGGTYLSTLNHCTLLNNSAAGGPYGFGGGAAQSTLNNCTLAGNFAARSGGGAMWEAIWAPGLTLNNCTLTGNSAESGGGSLWTAAETMWAR